MAEGEWGATYAATGRLELVGPGRKRSIEVPGVFESQWLVRDGLPQLMFTTGGVSDVSVGFQLHFSDRDARRLRCFYVTQPRYGGGSITYGIGPRRPLRW